MENGPSVSKGAGSRCHAPHEEHTVLGFQNTVSYNKLCPPDVWQVDSNNLGLCPVDKNKNDYCPYLIPISGSGDRLLNGPQINKVWKYLPLTPCLKEMENEFIYFSLGARSRSCKCVCSTWSRVTWPQPLTPGKIYESFCISFGKEWIQSVTTLNLSFCHTLPSFFITLAWSCLHFSTVEPWYKDHLWE